MNINKFPQQISNKPVAPSFKGCTPIPQTMTPLYPQSTSSSVMQIYPRQDEKKDLKDNFKLSIGYINDFHGQLTKMERTILPLQKYDLRVSGGDNYLGDEKNEAMNKGVQKYLNIANIDATPVGNHEVDMHQKSFMEVTKDLKAKMLNVNYRQVIDDPQEAQRLYKETNKAPINERFANSMIKNVRGEDIGLIGVSPIDMNARYTNPEDYDRCIVQDFDGTVDSIQKEADKLKEKGINKIVLLSHLGYKVDQKLPENLSGIDVIIGGHSHNLVRGIKQGENLLYSKDNEPVIITNGGKDGDFFGCTIIAYFLNYSI